jgi:hypothetical protein
MLSLFMLLPRIPSLLRVCYTANISEVERRKRNERVKSGKRFLCCNIPCKRIKQAVMLRFLYLNIYSFLIVLSGAIVLLLPFYRISVLIIIIQALLAIQLFIIAGKLFSTWNEKKRMLALLVKKNTGVFRPDTFQVFMQAPCSRLVVKATLADLGQKKQYHNLLKYKQPFIKSIVENMTPVKTTIYINEEA